MGMSYRRAWLLVESLNACFRQPVVTTRLGGRSGGGATLTAFGEEVIARYRQMETMAGRVLARDIAALEAALAPAAPATPAVPDPQLDEG